MSEETEPKEFTIVVERKRDFEFRVRFDNPQFPELTCDEPEPVGNGVGPNASRVLSAAVGNCLGASLLFCLQRAKQTVKEVRAEVTTRIARNEEGRWRVNHIGVKLHVGAKGTDPQKLQRCIEIFENFCIVTASVRQGIPIDVTVIPKT
jgi:uncharacterized OsmC-like protein